MLKYPVRVAAAIACCCVAASWSPGLAAGGIAPWEQWVSVPGIVDLGLPRSDGQLLVAGSAALYLLDSEGNLTPFARGPGGYRDDASLPAYLVTAPGGHVAAAGCDWTPDETFLLRLHVPIGLTRVSASGDESGSFVNLPGVSTLTGIAFDDQGAFDHRLLVSGVASGKTVIFAIDCNGAASVVTRSAPRLEGGLVVAPKTFGAFAGSLIAPDENSGRIYAIGPDGKVATIVTLQVAFGPGVGAESLGVVPPNFISGGGFAYVADHRTPGSAHPGTDSVLRVSSIELSTMQVADGDILVSTAGGAGIVAVRCATTCTVLPVMAPTKFHAEGHLVLAVNPAPASPPPAPVAAPVRKPLVPPAIADYVGLWGIPTVVFILLLGVVAALGVQAFRHRAR